MVSLARSFCCLASETRLFCRRLRRRWFLLLDLLTSCPMMLVVMLMLLSLLFLPRFSCFLSSPSFVNILGDPSVSVEVGKSVSPSELNLELGDWCAEIFACAFAVIVLLRAIIVANLGVAGDCRQTRVLPVSPFSVWLNQIRICWMMHALDGSPFNGSKWILNGSWMG